MKYLGSRVLFLLVFSLVFAGKLSAQNYVYDAGRPVYTTAEPLELGFINPANGNLHLEIPLTTLPQRGDRQFSAALVYDSRIWYPLSTWPPTNVKSADQTNPSWGGWRLITSADIGKHSYASNVVDFCNPDPPPTGGSIIEYSGFSWTSPDGVRHIFPGISTIRDPCEGGQSISSDDGPANDSSGLHMYVTGYFHATVVDRHGRRIYAEGANWTPDTNGNYFSGTVALEGTRNT
jgi:hypothetical protein